MDDRGSVDFVGFLQSVVQALPAELDAAGSRATKQAILKCGGL